MRLTAAIMAVLAAFGIVQSAGAHGIWVAERWGDLGIVYGHGAHDDPYDPAKIQSVTVLGESGDAVEAKIDRRENHALIAAEGEPSVILVDFDNGYYTEKPDGEWVNKPKSAVEGARQAGRYLKYAVSIVHLHDDVPALPAQDLQIVPLSNPTGLESGKSFKVRVLYKGEPLAGAAIIPDYVNKSGTKRGETDAAGEAEVTVRNDGLNVVAVVHEVPLDADPDADRIQHFATLSFEAGHDH